MRALRKHGIVNQVDEVVVARDGEEALDYVFGTGSYAGRDPDVIPEFVLLDVKLPKMDGLQVLERLRDDERTELLPVILFSSSREHEDVVAGYRLGANSYVAKPANFEKFSEAMQYLGWYWLSFNETP
ncbi:MAG: response regulator, partial [Actinomycetota bacterium]|nr:response regulator [Actinomycetota bacterium]